MGVFVIIGFGLYRFFPGFWRNHAWVIVSILGLCGLYIIVFFPFIFTWLRHKKQAGSVLLDLGRTKLHKIFLVTGGFGVVTFIISLVESLLDAGGVLGIKEVSISLFWLLFGVTFLVSGLSHFEIRECGILYFERFVNWEKIESYEWEGESGLTLTLRVRGRLSFLRTLSLPIPAIHKETVENLLAQNLPSDKSST